MKIHKGIEKDYINVDARLLKNKKELVEFANSLGYKYYSEYVVREMVEKKQTSGMIRKAMVATGMIDPPDRALIHSILYRTKILTMAKPQKLPKYIPSTRLGVQQPHKSKVCGTDGCSDEVPPENHRFCHKCYTANTLKTTYFDEDHGSMYA